MKRILVILVMLCFLFIAGCIKTESIPTLYGEFANAQRTSCMDTEGIKDIPDKVGWKYTLTEADEVNWLTETGPTIDGNITFLVSGSIISAIKKDTGEEVWRKDYSKPSLYGVPSDYASDFTHSLLIYNDKIVIIGGFSARQYIIVLNKTTGEPIWKSSIIGGSETMQTSGHPVILNGSIYLPATSSENYEKNKDAQAGIWVWDVETGKVLDRIFIEPAAEPIAGKYRSMNTASTFLAQDETEIYGITRLKNDSTYRSYIFCYDILERSSRGLNPLEKMDLNHLDTSRELQLVAIL